MTAADRTSASAHPEIMAGPAPHHPELLAPGAEAIQVIGKEGRGGKSCLSVAHSILGSRNMPPGLLCMERIVECVYNPNNGRFRVLQPVDECDATFGGHRVKLLREIAGRLVQDAIHELKGVKVKAAFFWINIWEILADPQPEGPSPGSLIHFRAGPFNASMPAQELWEYKFWADAFHEEPEKEDDATALAAAAGAKVPGLGSLSKIASKLHNPALAGGRV